MFGLIESVRKLVLSWLKVARQVSQASGIVGGKEAVCQGDFPVEELGHSEQYWEQGDLYKFETHVINKLSQVLRSIRPAIAKQVEEVEVGLKSSYWLSFLM
jgi:hypothetical protein